MALATFESEAKAKAEAMTNAELAEALRTYSTAAVSRQARWEAARRLDLLADIGPVTP
jgi:hypothetical protein